jgi:hemerythrin-like domain-containing protein
VTADPLQVFHREHDAIRLRLRSLEASLDAAMNRDRADASDVAAFREALAFLRGTVLDHVRREEESLLPALEAKVGRHGTLVDVILWDHDEVRREVGKLADALAALEAKAGGPHSAELRELNRHGIFLVQYLGLHMAKEDASLAEMAREVLGEEGLREVARRLEGG